MKKITKIIAACCALVLLLGMCVTSLTGCDRSGNNNVSNTDASDSSSDVSAVIVDGKTDYTVSVKSLGGVALSGITIFIYADEALEDLAGYGITDENGIAIINLKVASGYRVVLSDPPEGYVTEASYGFTGTSSNIVLTSRVIEDTDLSDVTYTLGSVMHDFTVTDPEGNSYTLSELLKEKDMVMLNFWYTTCSYCVAEFPYMDEAYNNYKEDIEIIAMNHYTADSEDEVSEFKATYGLTFPMVKENLGMQNAFNLQGYPTSVFIDRYGVIAGSPGHADLDDLILILVGQVGEGVFPAVFVGQSDRLAGSAGSAIHRLVQHNGDLIVGMVDSIAIAPHLVYRDGGFTIATAVSDLVFGVGYIFAFDDILI